MKEKTLSQICASTGATRRAIQGYEGRGLVSACGRTKYGYLLYDQATEERIRQIRFYQQIGFTVKEIAALMDAPAPDKKQALRQKLVRLQARLNELPALIAKTQALIDAL